jgi:uncharacterized protein (TIGR01777 family)
MIGRVLCRHLLASNYDVVVFSRNPEAARQIVPGAGDYVAWQAEEHGAWEAAVDGAWAVVNMAGAPFFTRWNAAYQREVSASRIRGTRGLINAMRAASVKPQVFISGSSQGFYGFDVHENDKEIDEDQAAGNDWWGQDSALVEQEIMRAEELGIRTIVVRTGIFLDAEAGALGSQLPRYKKGQINYVRPGNQWYPWIHADDEAGLIQFAIENEQVRGPLNATSPNPLRNRDFMRLVGKVLGKPMRGGLPGFLLRLFLGKVATVVIHGRRLVPKKALELGYQFQYPQAEAALRNLLNEE